MAKFTLNVGSSGASSIWSNSAQFQSAYIRRLRQRSYDVPGDPELGFGLVTLSGLSERRGYNYPQSNRNDATRDNAPISS